MSTDLDARAVPGRGAGAPTGGPRAPGGELSEGPAALTVGLVSDCFGETAWDGRVSIPQVALARSLEEIGVTVHRLHRAEDALRSRADVLHLVFATPLTHRVAARASAPYVVSLHEGSRISWLRPSDPAYPYDRGRWEPVLRRHLLRGAAAVIALCPAEADSLVREDPGLEPKVRVIPNGVDLARYRPARSRPGGPPVVLSVGQLRPHKGYGHLLRAVREVVDRGVDLRVRIVNHRRDFLPQYLRLAGELGLSSRVAFVPGTTTAGLVEEYSRAAIYVQPSLAEGAPVTVLEAMASGLPVVATDVACLRDQLGPAGLLVPPADHRALGEALYRLSTDGPLRARLGDAARARCEARFDIRSVADRHRRVYEEAVERRRQERGGRAARYRLAQVVAVRAEPEARRLAAAVWGRVAPSSYARWRARRTPPPL